MKKKLIIILIGLAFLTATLFIETPIEFLTVKSDIIGTSFIMLFLVLIFILLFKKIQNLESRKLKRLTLGVLVILAIPYFFIALWTSMLTWSNYHPMWQDLTIYTNDRNEKVISQWRETSGSIYDYRDRKIIAEYEYFRISFNCNAKKLKGVWKEYNIEKNRTTKVNLK